MIITQETAKEGHCFFSFEIKEAEIKIGHHNVAVLPDAPCSVHLLSRGYDSLLCCTCETEQTRLFGLI